MELSQIDAFVRVARAGSFTRAADEMGLTQPAVSSRIAALESELGGQLFERTGRTLNLTALGRRFLPYTERMLAVLADGLQEVKNYHSGRTGEIMIGAQAPLALSMLPAPLERFRAENPAVDISIRQRLTPEVLHMLHDGTATLGLIGSPLFDRAISVLARFQESVQCVVAASHPLALQQQELQAKGEALYMEDIYQYTIFRVTMFPRMTAFIEEVIENARQESGEAVVGVPVIMVVDLVRSGQGVAFLPQGMVQASVEAGELVFLEIADMPILTNEPLLVTLRERELDRSNLEFVRIFKAHWQHILVF
jgi:DNA-binding transcriptional LysR family regulator